MNYKTDYWLELCNDDLVTAKALLNAGRLLHMGFFCHLIAEKSLKAIIADIADEVPPKIHDLKALVKKAGITNDLSEAQLNLLEQLTPLQIETRYPEYKDKIVAVLSFEKCQKILNDTEEFLCWIKQRLGK